MTSRPAHSDACRLDYCQGDEDLPPDIAAEQQALIELRAGQLLAERLSDPAMFADLMCGIEPTTYYPHLQRAVLNLDRACKGEGIAMDAVLSALHQIQKIVRAEAKEVWSAECEAIAEMEIAP